MIVPVPHMFIAIAQKRGKRVRLSQSHTDLEVVTVTNLGWFVADGRGRRRAASGIMIDVGYRSVRVK